MRSRIVLGVGLLICIYLLLRWQTSPTADQPGAQTSSPTAEVVSPSPSVDQRTAVTAPPVAKGSGSDKDSCGLTPMATSQEIVLIQGTNATTICQFQASNGWRAFRGTATGTRTKLCGLTDGTAASEDVIEVFDSGEFSDGIATCLAFQSAGWGATGFWPVLDGRTPAPSGQVADAS